MQQFLLSRLLLLLLAVCASAIPPPGGSIDPSVQIAVYVREPWFQAVSILCLFVLLVCTVNCTCCKSATALELQKEMQALAKEDAEREKQEREKLKAEQEKKKAANRRYVDDED
uniref:Uncharacterized protein n=1 Tax=Chromera velia CCMP2878 TaxID=1169474 RepID=A0A0G4H8X7_9ALVE|eukprot:Cvel_25293.t1-p1 / transcript=Cvel_25293.t1 / gene=Cvel_25293 / organism=Chromera_velia_CCMP2878 / gene_product=hypothetical protein / transcript_product=hypothetical protein / location=Cvel_scaffold2844:1971-3414(-) / protein_length=113 / sequence_SO=supercontig / SO=protein_coding / is_pseudo=false